MSLFPETRLHPEGENLTVEEQVNSLVEEGRISEARLLLDTAGELVPAESEIREILSPPRVKPSDKRDVDRSAEFRWLDTHEAEYQGKWVALAKDKLVASSDTLKELLTQLDQFQFEQ